MAHGDAREGKWRGNWRMEWVASTLYTTSEHGASSITTADGHTSAASSRLNWRLRRFKWTRPFRRKTKKLVSARLPSHFKRSLQLTALSRQQCLCERASMLRYTSCWSSPVQFQHTAVATREIKSNSISSAGNHESWKGLSRGQAIGFSVA